MHRDHPERPDIADDVAMGRRQPVHQRKGLAPHLIGQSAGMAIPRRSFASNTACNTAKAFIRARLSDK
jgi:hypothetical protein